VCGAGAVPPPVESKGCATESHRRRIDFGHRYVREFQNPTESRLHLPSDGCRPSDERARAGPSPIVCTSRSIALVCCSNSRTVPSLGLTRIRLDGCAEHSATTGNKRLRRISISLQNQQLNHRCLYFAAASGERVLDSVLPAPRTTKPTPVPEHSRRLLAPNQPPRSNLTNRGHGLPTGPPA
jgi:hypothetical protein